MNCCSSLGKLDQSKYISMCIYIYHVETHMQVRVGCSIGEQTVALHEPKLDAAAALHTHKSSYNLCPTNWPTGLRVDSLERVRNYSWRCIY